MNRRLPGARYRPRRELFAWAMYDFANSGYTTVVLTTIFNAYFVGWWWEEQRFPGRYGHAALDRGREYSQCPGSGQCTRAGAIADYYAAKKRFLLVTTMAVSWAPPYWRSLDRGCWLAMTLVVLSNFTFCHGENLIAAFLPKSAIRAAWPSIGLWLGGGYLGA